MKGCRTATWTRVVTAGTGIPAEPANSLTKLLTKASPIEITQIKKTSSLLFIKKAKLVLKASKGPISSITRAYVVRESARLRIIM